MNQLVTIGKLKIALACILLFSCGKENDNRVFFNKEKPVIFSATVQHQLTRSTSNNTWDPGDEIGVRIGYEVKKYTSSSDGKLMAAPATEPFYWENQLETKTVTAWYPYSHTPPQKWTVQSNQAGNGYWQSDFLYVPATEIPYTKTEITPLPFHHQTAKVVIHILKSEAVGTADDISNVKIGNANNLALSANYTAPTDKNTSQGTWSTYSTMDVVIPHELESTETHLKSYVALLIPQDMTGKKFISVTLNNGNTYCYTPQNHEAILTGGKQYTYHVAVKNGNLEVEAMEGAEWTDGGRQAIVSNDVKTTYTSTDLKAGDYYYSDGTWSDGGLRRTYTNGKTAGAGSIPPISDKTVIGIVFWVGNPTEPMHNNGTTFTDFGDPALRREKPHCTHGLVVSLQEDSMMWQRKVSPVGEWVSGNTVYETITTNYDPTSALNKLRGYNNTQATRAYNTSLGSSGSENIVLPVEAIDSWAVNIPAPVNSSGWYFPSAKELSLLCAGDFKNVCFSFTKEINLRDLVNASLREVFGANTLSQSRYFSSSEYPYTDVHYILFSTGLAGNGKRKTEIHTVRAVLAF